MNRYTFLNLWKLVSVCMVAVLIFGLSGMASANQPELSNSDQEFTTPWLDAQEHEGIIYMLYTSPAHIKRYVFVSNGWLPTINLDETPNAFTVDAKNIYVAFGNVVKRYNLDGSGGSVFYQARKNIVSLLVDDTFLFIHTPVEQQMGDRPYLVVHKQTQTPVAYGPYNPPFFYDHIDPVISPSLKKIFSRTYGWGNPRILSIKYDEGGNYYSQQEDRYHGSYPSATKLWIFPNDKLVVDDSGTIYATENLLYQGTLGGAVDDVSFHDGAPLVLRQGTIIAFSPFLWETGRYYPSIAAKKIFVYGEKVFIFGEGQPNPAVEVVSINTFPQASLATPIDPTGVPYVADDVDIDNNEIIYLLSKKDRNIFRWSTAERKYITSIPLTFSPDRMAYSASNNSLYLAYSNGYITRILLNPPYTEEPFAISSGNSCGLAVAGKFVFACGKTGGYFAEVFYETYDQNGKLLSTQQWFAYVSSEFIWNESRQGIYFLTDTTGPIDLRMVHINTAGVIDGIKESPQHDSTGMTHPVRINGDGTKVLLGSGRFYDGNTLEHVSTLPNNANEAAWINDILYTYKWYGNDPNITPHLQKWKNDLTLEKSVNVSGLGQPIAMYPVQEGIVIVLYGRPYFTIWSPNLDPIYLPPFASFLPEPRSGIFPLTVHFQNLTKTNGHSDVSYMWDFGDGESSTEVHPSHTYMKSGTYTICLTATTSGMQDKSCWKGVIGVGGYLYMPAILTR